MLLSEFKQLQEIDQKLVELHNERTKLFTMGTFSYTPQTAVGMTNTNAVVGEQWVKQKYTELATKWQVQGVKVPTLRKLKAKLERANELLTQVSIIKPELFGRMSIVLVPPTKDILFSSAGNVKAKRQLLHLSNEYIEAKFAKTKVSKNWRVIVAFSETEGLYTGTPHQLLNEKSYMIAGYNCYALGTQEYAAMVMQESTVFDTTTSTALLKGCSATTDLVPSVTSDTSGYVFEAEAAISAFGDIRFRPSIEVE